MDTLEELNKRAEGFAHSAVEYFNLWDNEQSDAIWNLARCAYLTAYQDRTFGTSKEANLTQVQELPKVHQDGSGLPKE